MGSTQQKEVAALLKKIRKGIKALDSNSNISDQVGQKRLEDVIEMIDKIIQTNHYKIPFVKTTLQNEFFWFVTNVRDFGSRELAIKLCELQEKLSQ